MDHGKDVEGFTSALRDFLRRYLKWRIGGAASISWYTRLAGPPRIRAKS
jgi:hypothetical protein